MIEAAQNNVPESWTSVNISDQILHELFTSITSGVTIFDVMNDGSTDSDYKVIFRNNSALKIWQLQKQETGSLKRSARKTTADQYRLISTLIEVKKTGKAVHFLFAFDAFERTNWFDCNVFSMSSGKIVLIQDDVTGRVIAEQELRDREEKYRTLIENMNEVVYTLDTSARVTYISPNIEKLSGYKPADLLGKRFTDFVYADDLPGRMKNFLQVLTGTVEQTEYRILTAEGRTKWVSTQAAPIVKNDKTTGIQGILTDITTVKEAEKEKEYLNYHDSLTGLYNRKYIEAAIKKHDTDSSSPLSIIIVDVNGLKLTNDAFGHAAGDKLLQSVAEIMQKAGGHKAIIGRMGGDEFAMVAYRTDSLAAEQIINRIKSMADRLTLGPAVISLAAGYATKTNRDQDIDIIRTCAENMMYKNKLKFGKTMRSRTIETVIRSINNKYDNEQIHTERVAQYCEKFARALELDEKIVELIKTAGVLHDIGKIIIPADLLNKKGKLNDDEWAIVRRHPETSCLILREVDEYAELAEFVLYHHERWDGKGYPHQLTGEQIPYISRIISVVDAYEAMTADRPYQKQKTKEQALQEIILNAGKQFDPDIAVCFVQIMSN